MMAGPRERNGYQCHPAPEGCAHQAGRIHQVCSAFQQGYPHEQIHIGIKGKNENKGCASEAAHFGEQAPFQPEGVSHPGLGRATELQKVSVGIRDHVSRHGKGQ